MNNALIMSFVENTAFSLEQGGIDPMTKNLLKYTVLTYNYIYIYTSLIFYFNIDILFNLSRLFCLNFVYT